MKESAAACRVQTAREEEDGAHVPVLQAPTRLHLELKYFKANTSLLTTS